MIGKRALVACVIGLLPVVAMAWPAAVTTLTTTAPDNTTSQGVALNRYAKNVILRVPALESTSCTVHGSTDNVTYQPLYLSSDNVLDTPLGTGGIDMVMPAQLGAYKYVRIVCADNQSAPRAFKLFQE